VRVQEAGGSADELRLLAISTFVALGFVIFSAKSEARWVAMANMFLAHRYFCLQGYLQLFIFRLDSLLNDG
jgi:hypothetical protein